MSVKFPKSKIFKIFFTVIFTSLIILGVGFGTLYAIIPKRLAYPKMDHFHFRLQYVFRGQAENFGNPRYQIDYLKDVCNGALSESPIHFHDNQDQIVHLHWQGLTGGDVLKFYGNNTTGGLDNIMGYKLDQVLSLPPKITQVPIYGNNLPKAQGDDKYFIYTGEKNNFQKKNFDDFKNKTLEEFLGKNSKLREQFEEVEKLENKASFNPLAINVEAHNGEDHATLSEAEQHEADTKKAEADQKSIDERNNQLIKSTDNKITPTKTEEELKQINNLIGNIVIFVQPNEPTNDQIKARFDNLVPLGTSVCGG